MENSNADTCHDAYRSDAVTTVRSSNGNEDIESRSPVCQRQGVDSDYESHEEGQVPLNAMQGYGQQDERTLATTLQERDGTFQIAAGDAPSPQTIACRPSSAPAAILYRNTMRAHLGNDRVTKASSAASSPRSQRSSPTPTPMPTSTPSRAPTEEDLLLLLMRRQRVRDQAHNRLLSNMHQLQFENQHLKKQGLDRHTKLLHTERKWRDAVRESHIRERDIRVFGEKYDKLKTWARDMHDAFASTRAEGNRLNDEVAKLNSEKETQNSERSALLEKIEGVADPVRKFKEAIAELRAISVELESTQKSLAQAQNEVQHEKLKNEIHTHHIEKLESTQELMNSRLLKQQGEIQSSLSLLAGVLKQNDYSFLHDVVVELSGSMQGLQEHVTTKTENSAQFCSLLSVAEQNHAKLSTAIGSIAHAQDERQTAQSLTQEMDEMKAKHAAELADYSRKQLEAATDLEKARDELEEKRVRFREIETRSEQSEEQLSNCMAKLEDLEMNLSAEQKLVEQLRDTEEQLKKKVKDTEVARQGLARTVRQLEQKGKQHAGETACLKETSNGFEARTKELEKDIKTQQTRIEEKVAKVVELENSCKASETTKSHCQKTLKDALDKISTLQSTIDAKESRLQILQKDLDSAQASIEKIPGLQELVKKRDAENHELSKDNKSCHANVTIKETELLEKQRQIKELEEKVSKITKDSETLAALHERCDKKEEEIVALRVEKDNEIDILKTKNAQLTEDLKPLSVLVKLLTNEEKMALDDQVVRKVKSMIQCLHEQDCNNLAGENEITRPRRAANRDAPVGDEDVVVPDSQDQLPPYTVGSTGLRYGIAGSNTFIDEGIGPITNVTNLNMVAGSRPVPELKVRGASEDTRPATSNDEMLLRSSDTGSYPRSQSQAKMLVPASSFEVSPMRTRQGSQIRHGTPRPQSSADGERIVNFSTPSTYPKEIHPPNSAAKRRQTSEAPESAPKRRTVNMKNLEVRSSRHSIGSSLGQSSDAGDSQDLPSGARKSMGVVSSKSSAPQSRTKNKAGKPPKKNSKTAQYGVQFTESAMRTI